jgi:hypothetical protein
MSEEIDQLKQKIQELENELSEQRSLANYLAKENIEITSTVASYLRIVEKMIPEKTIIVPGE